MISDMADWEQPSTSLSKKAGFGGDSPDEQIEVLRQSLAAALERITSLEQRVSDLEAADGRGQALGA
jgi:hypothetical protein